MRIKIYSSTKWAVLLSIFFLLWGILIGANALFVISFIILLNMIFYCWAEIETRSILFAFGVTFGVFLVGREFLQVYLGYQVEGYSADVNQHTYICFILSLLGVWGAYFIAEYYGEKRKHRIVSSNHETNINEYSFGDNRFTIHVRQWSKLFFWVSMPLALTMRIIVALFVSTYSYNAYYTDFVELMYGSNIVLYIIGRLENLMPVFLGIFISTLPSKKVARPVFIVYFVYLIISLGGGNRGTFLLGILYLFVVIVFMQGIKPEEVWFKRKYMWFLVAMLPVVAITGSVYNTVRWGGSAEINSLFQEFVKFFYDQGVTVTVVKHAYEFSDRLPKQHYLLEFMHSGVLARLFGITVLHGNTVEHALYGGSMNYSLAYVVMGSMYLSGQGTGTSYLAELYYDLGYFGVLFGNIIYGVLFYRIRDVRTSLFKRAVIFVLMTQLLWAPRGSCTGFISFFFAPTTLGALAIVWALANITTRQESYRINN